MFKAKDTQISIQKLLHSRCPKNKWLAEDSRGRQDHFYKTFYSIVVSIPACHAGDRGSIPRRGAMLLLVSLWL